MWHHPTAGSPQYSHFLVGSAVFELSACGRWVALALAGDNSHRLPNLAASSRSAPSAHLDNMLHVDIVVCVKQLRRRNPVKERQNGMNKILFTGVPSITISFIVACVPPPPQPQSSQPQSPQSQSPQSQSPQPQAAQPQIVPASSVVVQLDQAKLDADGKYAQPGELRIPNLFRRDGQDREVVIRIALSKTFGSKLLRSYEIMPTATSMGAVANFLMTDGGIATVTIPKEPGKTENVLKLSKDNLQMVVMMSPRGEGVVTTCYLGKDVFSGGLRFAVCNLPLRGWSIDTEAAPPYIGFIDTESVPKPKK
jgi:hypothetical protein